MIRTQKIRVGRKSVEALEIKLSAKKLILLKGSRGFVMCGYLDLSVAEKFGDAAVRITGVSTIAEALRASVRSCTSSARKLGVRRNLLVRDILPLIA